MYLNFLDKEEKLAFLNIAMTLVNADGDFSDEEKNLIEAAAKELELSIPPTTKNVNIIEECTKFKNNKSRKIAVIELLILALADGNISKSEEDIIENILSNFNLTDEFLYDASQLANSIFGLFKTGIRLISEDV